MRDVREISFDWKRSRDHDRGARAHHPLVIVGAGPVGLVAALDLAAKGHRSVVIEKKGNLSDGSRAICWSKRTLEIMDRLGVGQVLLDKGVTWKNGRVFFDTRQVFAFDLLPEPDHRMPAFVNLQQYYFEHYCVEAAVRTGLIEIRWHEEVQGKSVYRCVMRIETRKSGSYMGPSNHRARGPRLVGRGCEPGSAPCAGQAQLEF